MELTHLKVGTLKLQIHDSPVAAGEAAAQAVAETLKQLNQNGNRIGVIFATGASQLDTLRALIAISGLPWEKVHGFHMDEYMGIDKGHPASFRRYLRENLTQRVPMEEFFEIDGSSPTRSASSGSMCNNCGRLNRSYVCWG